MDEITPSQSAGSPEPAARAKISANRELAVLSQTTAQTARCEALFDVPRIKVLEPLAFLKSLSSSLQNIQSLGVVKIDSTKTAEQIVTMSREGWFVDGKMGVPTAYLQGIHR